MCRIKQLLQAFDLTEDELGALIGYSEPSGMRSARTRGASRFGEVLLTVLSELTKRERCDPVVQALLKHWIALGVPQSEWQKDHIMRAASKLLGPEEYAQWGERFRAVHPEFFPAEDIRKAA